MSLSPGRKKSVVPTTAAANSPTSGSSIKDKTMLSMKKKYKSHTIVYLPANYPSCPPGLEKLITVDHLFVRQGMRDPDPPWAMVNKSKFEVLNGEGRRIFLAKEAKDNILKLCCRGGCGQPFEMSIKDRHSGYEILAVNGHPDCYGAMSASISQNGMSLGFLNEELRCCSSNYIVIDAQGNEIFRIYDVGAYRLQKTNNKRIASLTRRLHGQNPNPQIEDIQNAPVIIESGVSDATPENLIISAKTSKSSKPVITDKFLSVYYTAKSSESINSAVDDSSNLKTSSTTNPRSRTPSRWSPVPDRSPLGHRRSPRPLTPLRAFTKPALSPRGSPILQRKSLTPISPVSLLPPPAVSVRRSPVPIRRSPRPGDPLGSQLSLRRSPFPEAGRTVGGEFYKSNRALMESERGVIGCLDSCVSRISGGAEFDLYSCEMGVVIGKMSKQWDDIYEEHFNLVDCFGVSFPRDLSVRHKALILGALFLLDLNHGQL